MNQLNAHHDYPYLFFPERSFHEEQVTGYIMQNYRYMMEDMQEVIPFLGPLTIGGSGMELYKLASIARTCILGEPFSNPLFGDATEEVIDLYNEFDGDIIKVNNEVAMFSRTSDQENLFKHDIRLALQKSNVFFMDFDGSYETLFILPNALKKKGIHGHPLTEEGKKKLFVNMPVKEVW